MPIAASLPRCPSCQCALKRVRRHLGDRLVSVFVSRLHCRYRYRCLSKACGWHGCLTFARPAYGQPGARDVRID